MKMSSRRRRQLIRLLLVVGRFVWLVDQLLALIHRLRK